MGYDKRVRTSGQTRRTRESVANDDVISWGLETMLMRSAIAIAAVLALGASGENEPATSRPGPIIPADYKLVIAVYGVAKEPISKTQLVVHKGRAFLFNPGPPLEVIIHDPSAERLEMVDLKRKIRSEITFKKLDEYTIKLHDAIAAASAKREALGGKGNQVMAAMSRDLIDPHFTNSYDAATHRLRMTNPSIEVEARGEPEVDEARWASIHSILVALTKMDAVRNPQEIPPFSKLEALHGLMVDHRLRPTELSFIYRLAGAPQKLRWTYQLEPSLTKRETEAIATVEAIHGLCRFARFSRYGPTERKKVQ
ncbi:hypothetical protein V5E97_19695 [Singulisphaera sp. Ch08]|uniref:DUF4412 domain-containing protein n=1 Tax=Singulisphaera sp. Ch08 TaxID=3120278 RepID=A0AAU7CTE5_9BACT